MKVAFVCLFALLVFCSTSICQDENKIGVGASFGLNITADSPSQIFNFSMVYVPINLSGIRLEPFILFYSSSYSYQIEGQTDKTERSMSSLTFGSGIFYLMKANKSVVPYLGARIGYGTDASKSKSQYSNTDESGAHLFLGGVLGGDYYFSPNFSLGAEIGISYNTYFTPTEKSGQSETKYSSYSNSQITSSGQIIARIFF